MTLFLILIGLHFLCDYPLQGDFLARGKSNFAEPLFGIPWWHCNLAHAAIHGLAVGMATHSPMLGLLETIAHFFIDMGKSKKLFGINVDQALHIACKVAWSAIAAGVLK